MKKPFLFYIEDDLFEKKLFEKAMTELGSNAEFKIFGDGESFLSFINTTATLPDLILTDNFLPGISGFEIVSKMREESKFNSVPIIVLSNLLHSTELQKANLVKPDRYIQKPWDYEDYKDLISNLCYSSSDLRDGIN